MYCACATSFLFILNQLYLMTHMSFGQGKGVIVFCFDSFFIQCEQFCLGRTFFMIFTL